MADRVFLHIGVPKSGTTYLQAGLWQNREPLRDQGLLFPGRGPFDHNRASIALHRTAGFVQVGLLPTIGFKSGQWLDAIVMQRSLGEGATTLPEVG